MPSVYDPASHPTGVPSPFGGRVHSYPTRFHGLDLQRVQQRFTWSPQPLWGVGGCSSCAMGAEEPDEDKGPSAGKIVIAVGLTALVVVAAITIAPKLVGGK